MSKDLREFLRVVKEAGPDYYVEVNQPLSPELETCVIQQKLAREGRFPVIYYPAIKGSKLPVVANLFGSWELLGLAVDMNPKKVRKSEIFHEYRRRRENTKPVKWVSASEAPVKEVILKDKDVDLDLLPITKQAVLNSGKYIPVGQMVCQDPETKIPNVGIYRHEVKGRDKLGAWAGLQQNAAYIARRYAELGKPMEIVIYIGHHPAVGIASQFTGPLGVNELEIAGGYLGEPLEVVKAETVDLPVPARAEIAIEGKIYPGEMTTDGPYSEWSGYYGTSQDCYLIHVTGITMRKDAIYHDLDPAHREHNMMCTMGYTSTIYDAVKGVVPSIKDVHMPPSGKHLLTAYISIRKRIEGEGKRAALAAVNSVVTTKIVVVVDEDIDVYDEEEVLWAVATRVCPDRDVNIIPFLLAGPLDPTSYDETRLKRGTMNSKMIIDATKPVGLPFATRITPPSDLWQRMKLDDYLK